MEGGLTLAVIRPELVRERKVGEAISFMENSGFSILLCKMIQLRPEGVVEYLRDNTHPDYADQCLALCKGPLWVLVLSKNNAVAAFLEAIQETFFSKYLIGSADNESARREINFFFGREIKLASAVKELDQ